MAKLPVLTLLCIFALGALLLVGRGQQPDPSPRFRPANGPAGSPENDPGGSAEKGLTPGSKRSNADSASAVDPRVLMSEAVRRLERHRSISASIRHEIDLFAQHLTGSGGYWEHRTLGDPRIRLELKIQLGSQTSSLLQVCDGTHLWTYRKLLDEPTLSQVDVALATDRLRRAATAPGRNPAATLPGLGGLSRILRGLDGAFEFTTAERGRLGQENRPIWRLHGRWRANWLARILPAQTTDAAEDAAAPDLSRLPEHLPDHVILYLEQADLFPYRIEYRRRTESSSRALVTMQWYDVKLNGPVDHNRFIYHPGDLKPVDRTQEFLDSLIEQP